MDDALNGLLRANIGEGHGRTVRCQPLCNGRADASAAAGDEGALAGKNRGHGGPHSVRGDNDLAEGVAVSERLESIEGVFENEGRMDWH